MKNQIILYFLLIFNISQAQISIGKNTIDGNGLLDFSSDNKGIILPIVDVKENSVYTNGTLLYDSNDNVVKIRENNKWVNLSFTGTLNEFKSESTNQIINTKRVVNQSADHGKGMIIGASSSAAEGVLVLESTTHSLILPKVTNPHLTILSPTAGTIVYDNYSKSLAIFDGKVWNYWK